jgi:hypothetical protein
MKEFLLAGGNATFTRTFPHGCAARGAAHLAPPFGGLDYRPPASLHSDLRGPPGRRRVRRGIVVVTSDNRMDFPRAKAQAGTEVGHAPAKTKGAPSEPAKGRAAWLRNNRITALAKCSWAAVIVPSRHCSPIAPGDYSLISAQSRANRTYDRQRTACSSGLVVVSTPQAKRSARRRFRSRSQAGWCDARSLACECKSCRFPAESRSIDGRVDGKINPGADSRS